MAYQKSNPQLDLLLKYALPLLGIYLAFKAFKMFLSGKQAANKIGADIGSSAQVQGINIALNQNGIHDVRGKAVLEAAEDIYNAFHKDSFWGMGEDEPKAINAFNSLTSLGEAKACAIIYKSNFKKSLYGDLLKYCNGSNYAALRTSYLNAIKKL